MFEIEFITARKRELLMSIQFRNYTKQAGITEDYHKVREFFVNLGYSEFTYARWDWMATHIYLDKSTIGKIGIWQDSEQIVGVATFDIQPGSAYCLTLPEYAFLKKEMLLYANDNLKKNVEFGIVISDLDSKFQDIAVHLGYVATNEKESESIFYLDRTPPACNLPRGFHITALKETYDLYQYKRVLWKGFNHELNGEGEFKYSEQIEQEANQEMMRPNVDLSLKIAVVAPNGNFVSYCGMWYDQKAGFAEIEPVATDPDYRKMGLGKALVLEGIRRVGKLGAKTALVGSSQQFYYSIGLRPFRTATIWRKE